MKYANFIFLFVVWGTQCYKFARDNPVEIAVLYFLVVLILSNIKLLVVEPTQFHRVVQSPETIKNLNMT